MSDTTTLDDTPDADLPEIVESDYLGADGTAQDTPLKTRVLLPFLVPLLSLLYTLMLANWDAGKAGMLAVVTTFLVGTLQKETRPTWRGIVGALEGTGRTMLDLVAITTLAGIVIGAFQLSGLTSKLPLLLVSTAGGNVFLLLVLTALVSIFLGMSLPTTVVYITLAVLVGPALAQLGIVPLAAHLFLFYFGMLSLITPPDCLATYAAAAIAKSDFWKTGWVAMRLGIVAYIVPFVFVYHPALIFKGGWLDIATAVFTAAIALRTASLFPFTPSVSSCGAKSGNSSSAGVMDRYCPFIHSSFVMSKIAAFC